MSAAAPASSALDYSRLPIPAAVFEVLSYLIIVGAATLAFLAGWLTINAAVVLSVLLLGSLIVLSWINLGQGRHPVFLFLCTLMFFQGGRLIAFCLGLEPDPLRVTVMDVSFALTKPQQGIVLLSIVMSAICVYVPCRLKTSGAQSFADASTHRYLPYLYIAFLLTLPAQLYKGVSYYRYAMSHGGYVFLYIDHSALAGTIPFWVRVFSAISPVAFVAIFVAEQRRKRLLLTTVLYFAATAPVMLLGSRMGTFSLILSLFYVWRVKAGGAFRLRRVVALFLVMMLFAGFLGTIRSEWEREQGFILPLEFMRQQGISLNVTEVNVSHSDVFRPYMASYLYNEIQAAFVGSGAYNLVRGRMWDADVSNFLDARLYQAGIGVGGSYIAESYAYWGFVGVLIVSTLLGYLLVFLTRLSKSPYSLFIVALILPEILLMPRGSLVAWLSVLARNFVSIAILFAGWLVYSQLLSLKSEKHAA